MTAPRPARSLRWRLLAATVIAIGLALALAGLGLHRLFQDHVLRQFESALSLQLDELTARIDFDAQGAPVVDAQQLSDPRWSKPLSGLYWQVDAIDAAGATRHAVLRSRSLWDTQLSTAADALDDGQVHRHLVHGPRGAELMLLERTVSAPEGRAARWRLLVAGDLAPTQAALADFTRELAASLGVLLALLAAAAWGQVAVGLRPLRQLQQRLRDVQAGRAQRLSGRFPSELGALVDDFNRVLDQNAAIVERARTQAGNLAHALKTPLAVLDQVASHPPADGAWAPQVQAQVALARRHIDWHLAHARLVAAGQARGQRAPVADTVQGLVRVLQRLHAQRGLAFDTDTPDAGPVFAGAAQDLQEILGNLMDNACKWARTRVHVQARLLPAGAQAGAAADPGPSGASTRWLEVRIDDDGPGIDTAQVDAVLARGVRLDEAVPGSGLGLAIVHDAVRAYGGALALERSPLGGLRARVTLPAADYS